MSEALITTIITSILSASVFSFIQFLIERKDKKKSNSDEVVKKLDEIQVELEKNKKANKKAEIDNVRLQLMMMYKLYPDKDEKIIEIAHHYFVDLGGNWYATELFDEYLETNNVDKPMWFKNKSKETI